MDCVQTIVPKSPHVVWWSVGGMVTVSLVFAAGLFNALYVGYMPVPSEHHTMPAGSDESTELHDKKKKAHMAATPDTATAMDL